MSINAKFKLMILFITFGLVASAQKVDMDQFRGMSPRNIGPAGMSGRVTSIAVDPTNKDLFYVGTASGGLWKTTNGGITFSPLFDDQKVASIGALAVDPLRPDVIWAGTGEGNPRNSVSGGYGLYKSLDGGKSWQLSGLEETRHIHRIIVNPVNSDIVYVGAIGSPWAPNSERGVYKTTDGGKSWKKILYKNESTGVADMVMDPKNPDKIFVALWNHQRWPWFFNSGGEGSGIFVTLDGGENFSKLEGGLPEKIGRVGLAISHSNPNIVYAHVESEVNAMYRSEDGGFTWEKRATENIGNRPFYYSDIYVDPSNENRIFTLFSGINVSEDGAKTFNESIGTSVHLDHHAWWIDPENPNHMIDGNDGGLAITYDRGKTWRHTTNLPVGQFYHVSVDMETPYNVYGGMQDNGSWRGPAYTWYNGGIINEFWDFLIGGDGFDALPVPGDPRYCYAQSQGGSVRRIDLETGATSSIRPQPENGTRLRFNWNAAIAQDPFDANTIYFGSQFVHKSTDRGDSWEVISPDLTTNDPEKQKQRQSGGLTIDATGAENHCTILAITPSPVKKGVIWASTDDGNLQLTMDGGNTWEKISGNIKGLPANAWIPQVKVSDKNEGEAFVVVNNYRQGDYSSYLYHTKNYGKSWERIVDNNDVWGYVLSFVQDTKEPNLMFLGTEYGLYVSFDGAVTWNRWTVDYPTVSTYDLVIHPRENDLVIATFGRSIWVLDDIVPLRKIAAGGAQILDNDLILFDPPSAIIANTRNLPGYYYRADGMFMGKNRPNAASITFYAKEKKDDKLVLTVADDSGNQVRKTEFEYTAGINRVFWNYDMDPPEMPGMTSQQGAQGGRNRFRRRGSTVLPGTYTLTASLNGVSASANIEISSDPRMPSPNVEAVRENLLRAAEIQKSVKSYNELYNEFRGVRDKLSKINDLVSGNEELASLHKEAYEKVYGKFNSLTRELTNRSEDGLGRRMFGLSALYSAKDKLTQVEEKSVSDAVSAIEESRSKIKEFMESDWVEYLEFLKENNITLDRLIEK